MESGIDDGGSLSRAIRAHQHLRGDRRFVAGTTTDIDVLHLHVALDGSLHPTQRAKVQALLGSLSERFCFEDRYLDLAAIRCGVRDGIADLCAHDRRTKR